MSVRRATQDDVGAIEALAASLGIDGWPRAAILEELGAARSLVLCAREGGSIAGFAIVRWVLDEGELLAIAVDEGARRRGLGRGLVAALARELAWSGVGTLHLEVRASNVAARAFYGAEGFEHSGTRKRYYRNGEDAELYWLAIPE
ncbi:MAG: ribosomal protein S18-alanine N-acetyltransferase [Deltaproteobacteria bacterium]|nr:ribosomal protein S18-alanine N-acetyltransferase [Deltaproteobacteria bacterium]